jgi:hypothetical protein
MATRTGIDAQIGFVKESTWGTYLAPNRFTEFNSESIKRIIDRIDSAGIRAGKFNKMRSGLYASHQKGAAGSIEMELQTKTLGFFMEHLMGTVVTTNPVGGVFVHTGSVGSLVGKSFTCQVGRPDSAAGTVRPFSYSGGKITGWTIKCAVGEIAVLSFDCDFASEDTAQSLVAASIASGLNVLSFIEGTLTVAAGGVKVREISIQGNNGLKTDRFFTGGTKREQLDTGRQYSGSLVADFEDLTAYNRFVNATEVTLDLLFQGAVITGGHNYQLDINVPVVRFDGETPVVEGKEDLKQPLNFTALDDSITLAYKTSDATP